MSARHQCLLILDYGSQYTQLISRRLREMGVYSEIRPYQSGAAAPEGTELIGLVLSGGPASVYAPGAPQLDPSLLKTGVPVLGICYGMQLITRQLKGQVSRGHKMEYGRTQLTADTSTVLFKGLNPRLMAWMSHGDCITHAPPGFTVTAHTSTTPVCAFENPAKKLYGVQFHPEVTHTPWGTELLRRFAYDVCDARGDWTMASFIEESVAQMRTQVGGEHVLCALSGGVDSAATAVLVHRAIGDRLQCIFVDHGLLRQGESDQVEQTFKGNFGINFKRVNAQKRFLSALKGVTDPERKRKIIGREFVRVFEEESKKLGTFKYLAQGTLYPDVIESVSSVGGPSMKIKSHHNVGGLPKRMGFKGLVEPLRLLFKDEVRAICTQLGLPAAITWRQPFPGPGLAIRIIGEVTSERLKILRQADAIVVEEIAQADLPVRVWQAFAVLPAVRSVGVMGDGRTYAYPIVVRAVTSEDGMTADWARLPHNVMEKLASRIVNEVRGVNRVVLDITSKPPGTIEWE